MRMKEFVMCHPESS